MDCDLLYHVSDRPDIVRFEPRPPPSRDAGVDDPVVWAISDSLLHNYLLPRDCPRVTFYAGPRTLPEDSDRLLAGVTARHVVAVEHGWLERIRTATLWVYALPSRTFALVDSGAGYFVSRHPVTPVRVTEVGDVLGALVARDIELRLVPSLWPLRDAVHASTLAYSFIRMRHAAPRVNPVASVAASA